MPAYDLTQVENATSLVDLFAGVNTATNGLLVTLSLACIFFVFLAMTIRNNANPEAFFASSLTTAMAALFLSMMGVCSTIHPTMYGLIAAASAMAIYKSNSS